MRDKIRNYNFQEANSFDHFLKIVAVEEANYIFSVAK